MVCINKDNTKSRPNRQIQTQLSKRSKNLMSHTAITMWVSSSSMPSHRSLLLRTPTGMFQLIIYPLFFLRTWLSRSSNEAYCPYAPCPMPLNQTLFLYSFSVVADQSFDAGRPSRCPLERTISLTLLNSLSILAWLKLQQGLTVPMLLSPLSFSLPSFLSRFACCGCTRSQSNLIQPKTFCVPRRNDGTTCRGSSYKEKQVCKLKAYTQTTTVSCDMCDSDLILS